MYPSARRINKCTHVPIHISVFIYCVKLSVCGGEERTCVCVCALLPCFIPELGDFEKKVYSQASRMSVLRYYACINKKFFTGEEDRE